MNWCDGGVGQDLRPPNAQIDWEAKAGEIV